MKPLSKTLKNIQTLIKQREPRKDLLSTPQPGLPAVTGKTTLDIYKKTPVPQALTKEQVLQIYSEMRRLRGKIKFEWRRNENGKMFRVPTIAEKIPNGLLESACAKVYPGAIKNAIGYIGQFKTYPGVSRPQVLQMNAEYEAKFSEISYTALKSAVDRLIYSEGAFFPTPNQIKQIIEEEQQWIDETVTLLLKCEYVPPEE